MLCKIRNEGGYSSVCNSSASLEAFMHHFCRKSNAEMQVGLHQYSTMCSVNLCYLIL